MIKEIVLKNFRPHKSLVLKDLHPNLNVIIGDTGTGKTSIFRALRLLFNNEPSGGAKLYKFKEQTELIIKAIVNNSELIRKPKSYSIKRKGKTWSLTSFGKSVPEPIKDIIDLQEINWQLQIQPHFLILDNGGTVARFLNPILGSDESDLIIKEIKKQVETSRAEIRALNLIVVDNDKIVNRYLNIPEFKKRIEEIQNHIYLLQSLHSKIFSLEEKLNSINEIKNEIINPDKIKGYMDLISTIETKSKKMGKRKKEIEDIEYNLKQLVKIKEKYTTIPINSFTERIIKIEKKKTKENSVQEGIDKIESLLKSWEKIKEALKEGNDTYSELLSKWEEELSKLKICPFCEQEIKNARSHIHNRSTHIWKKSNLQIR